MIPAVFNGRIILAAACIAIAIGNTACVSAEFSIGAEVKSPNGRFTARCEGGGILPAVNLLSVVDNTTDKVVYTAEINSPLYSIGWTKNSKTLLLIDHLAGGSVAKVLHYQASGWKAYSADPREGDKYSVIRRVLGDDTVQLTYKITLLPRETTQGRLYLYEFVFHPDTTAHTNEKRTDVDTETYRKLRLE